MFKNNKENNDLGVYSDDIDIMLEVANEVFCRTVSLSWSTWQKVHGYHSATLVKHSSKMNTSKLLNTRRTILTCKAIWSLSKNILKLEDNDKNRIKCYREGLRFYVTVWPPTMSWYREFKGFLKKWKKK